MYLAATNDQKYPRYPLILKFKITLARLLRLVILYFLNGNSCQMIGACIFMTANGTRDLMWMGSTIQKSAKFIGHSIFKICLQLVTRVPLSFLMEGVHI